MAQLTKELNHSTRAVPSLRAVINKLITGEAVHHTDWTKAHEGEQHRLGLAIYKLRHKFGFAHLIKCPRERNHPLSCHYFIMNSDLEEARKLARFHGLI